MSAGATLNEKAPVFKLSTSLDSTRPQTYWRNKNGKQVLVVPKKPGVGTSEETIFFVT